MSFSHNAVKSLATTQLHQTCDIQESLERDHRWQERISVSNENVCERRATISFNSTWVVPSHVGP